MTTKKAEYKNGKTCKHCGKQNIDIIGSAGLNPGGGLYRRFVHFSCRSGCERKWTMEFYPDGQFKKEIKYKLKGAKK